MLSDELSDDSREPSRAEELADEETLTLPPGEYEIWSPYDAYEAVDALTKVLKEYRDRAQSLSHF